MNSITTGERQEVRKFPVVQTKEDLYTINGTTRRNRQLRLTDRKPRERKKERKREREKSRGEEKGNCKVDINGGPTGIEQEREEERKRGREIKWMERGRKWRFVLVQQFTKLYISTVRFEVYMPFIKRGRKEKENPVTRCSKSPACDSSSTSG